jgi:peptide-methionine (S)-S-oxide reductase
MPLLSLAFTGMTNYTNMTLQTNSKTETAYLGGGCFWCTEAAFQLVPGVVKVTPGYAGGHTQNPTYDEVCTGTTGHAQVVKIEFNPEIISYKDILKIFFKIHDPTTPNRQGNDIGPQYRSIIFYTNQVQQQTAEPFLKNTITELVPLTIFYPAEPYHHNYFKNNPHQAYCQFVIRPKLVKHKLL